MLFVVTAAGRLRVRASIAAAAAAAATASALSPPSVFPSSVAVSACCGPRRRLPAQVLAASISPTRSLSSFAASREDCYTGPVRGGAAAAAAGGGGGGGGGHKKELQDQESGGAGEGGRAAQTHPHSSPEPSSSAAVPAPAPVLAAYSYRLQSCRFTSLCDLAHAPYAPSSLRVLQDVVRLLRDLEAAQVPKKEGALEGGTDTHRHPSNADGATPLATSSRGSCTAASPPFTSTGHSGAGGAGAGVVPGQCQGLCPLALCRQVLSFPREVERLLLEMQRRVEETAAAAEVMGGDDLSREALRDATREITQFADLVQEEVERRASLSMQDAGEEEKMKKVWPLPPSVLVVLHRGVLALAAPLGLHVLAVESIEALRRLHQEAAARVALEDARNEQQHEPAPQQGGNAGRSPVEEKEEEEEEDEDISLDSVLEVVERDAQRATEQQNLIPLSTPALLWSTAVAAGRGHTVKHYTHIALTPQDHVWAIRSCAAARQFDLALALYRRLEADMEEATKYIQQQQQQQHGPVHRAAPEELHGSATAALLPHSSGSMSSSSLSLIRSEISSALQDALVALARSSRDHHDFEQLRSLLVNSPFAAQYIPVSVELYTALLHAVSRAAPSAAAETYQSELHRLGAGAESALSMEDGLHYSAMRHAPANAAAVAVAARYQQYLAVALAFYRRLRDGGLVPSPDTYAALIACAAVCREPTQAFAFYHEARVICGKRRPQSHDRGGDRTSSMVLADRDPQGGRGEDGTSSFPPSLYTNLLLAYHHAGYAADAKKTLEVLVEAGAPLERAAFHAVLASCLSLRDGQEVVKLMHEHYHIRPTPHTYAFLLQAVVRRPPSSSGGDGVRRNNKKKQTRRYTTAARTQTFGGVDALLHLYDLHELAMQSLLDIVGTETDAAQEDGGRGATGRQDLERILAQRYPPYVSSLTHALLQLRLDTKMDPRLQQYLAPLLRLVQLSMNAKLGYAPQCPTFIPQPPSATSSGPGHASSSSSSSLHSRPSPPLCVAVLAADVLANIDEFVLPFLSHYSLLVIPFSALVALQAHGAVGEMGRGADQPHEELLRTATAVHEKHRKASQQDQPGQEEEGEGQTTTSTDTSVALSSASASPRTSQERRWRRLQRFIRAYGSSIHIMSAEEEVRWSRDVSRYGIPRRDQLGCAAAITMNLARQDIPGNTKLYAAPVGSSSSPTASAGPRPDAAPVLLVLVSTSFSRCGRYLVNFKRQVLQENQRWAAYEANPCGPPPCGPASARPSQPLVAAMRRVVYHNPATTPHWAPPRMSAAQQANKTEKGKEDAVEEDEEEMMAAAMMDAVEEEQTSIPVPPRREEEEEMWRRRIARRWPTPSALHGGEGRDDPVLYRLLLQQHSHDSDSTPNLKKQRSAAHTSREKESSSPSARAATAAPAPQTTRLTQTPATAVPSPLPGPGFSAFAALRPPLLYQRSSSSSSSLSSSSPGSPVGTVTEERGDDDAALSAALLEDLLCAAAMESEELVEKSGSSDRKKNTS